MPATERSASRLASGSGRWFDRNFTPEKFSDGEKAILGHFFTNTDRPVFFARNLSPIMVGSLIGKHSQTPDSMRRSLLRYVPESGRTELAGRLEYLEQTEVLLAEDRAAGLIGKNFGERGHDSLAATMPFILGLEGASQLLAKAVEDTRLGLSPMERSTRYGFFGKKEDGRYSYARPPKVMAEFGEEYETAVDGAFDLYAQLQEPVSATYRKKFPDLDERAIRIKTFDTVRVLLTAGTFTNLACLVNGQAMEHLIIKLLANPMQEMQETGKMIIEECDKMAPELMVRAKGDYGREAVAYLQERDRTTAEMAECLVFDRPPRRAETGAELVWFDSEGQDKVVALVLWPGSGMNYGQVLNKVQRLSEESKTDIINRHLGVRPNRRVKVSRAFEAANMAFQINLRFAEWRDLQRNRILTPSRQTLDYSLGIDVGDDLREFGFAGVVEEQLKRLADLHEKVARKNPLEAQYLIAFGAKMSYVVVLNFRELVHIAELRTDQGAHEEYARIASQMAQEALRAYPLFKNAFQFVNWRN